MSRQVGQAVQAGQRGGDFGIEIAGLARKLFEMPHLGFEHPFLALQLVEDGGHGAELFRAFGQAQVFTGTFALGPHNGQGRLFAGQGGVRPGVGAFPLSDGPQLPRQLFAQGRGKKALTDASQQEFRRHQAVNVVVLALRAMTLLVQTAQVAE